MPNIGRYRIAYASSSNQNWVAEIRCYDANDFNQIGAIRFYKQGVAIPADSLSSGKPILNFELSRFNDVVTLLRSEDYVNIDNSFYGSLGTSVNAYGLYTGGEFTGDLEVN